MLDCPPSLLGVRTYFLRADELKLSRPYVAHRLRLFAVELAMKVKGPDAGRFLMGQMEELEQEKAAHIPPPMIRKPAPPGSSKPAGTAAPPASSTHAPSAAPSPAAPPTGEVSSMDAALDAAEGKTPEGKAKEGKASGGKIAITKPGAASPSPTLDMDAALDREEASLGQASPRQGPPAAGSMDALLDAAQGTKDTRGGTQDAGAGTKDTVGSSGTVLAPAGEEEAIRACGLDLYERGRVADRPGTFPSPAVSWSVTDAPRVAQCLHAAAVVLDTLKLFRPDLPTDLQQFQAAAHRRSAQLASQIAHAFKTPPGIPLDWAPADARAPPRPPPVKAEAPPQGPLPALFPVVPGRG